MSFLSRETTSSDEVISLIDEIDRETRSSVRECVLVSVGYVFRDGQDGIVWESPIRTPRHCLSTLHQLAHARLMRDPVVFISNRYATDKILGTTVVAPMDRIRNILIRVEKMPEPEENRQYRYIGPDPSAT